MPCARWLDDCISEGFKKEKSLKSFEQFLQRIVKNQVLQDNQEYPAQAELIEHGE